MARQNELEYWELFLEWFSSHSELTVTKAQVAVHMEGVGTVVAAKTSDAMTILTQDRLNRCTIDASSLLASG